MLKHIWRWFAGIFGNNHHHHCCKKIISGEIVLGCGSHEIEINIPGQPCKVSFDIEDDGCCVCHGEVNKIGITIGKSGFVIHANINSNTCLIRWHCEYTEV
jgi:hypothetical protein